MTEQPESIRVMFVDDEINILKTLKRMMSFEAYECVYASSGPEALELLESDPCDIIISDMRMPAMNGDAFLTKAKVLCPESQRFILSGYADFNSLVTALNEGHIQQFISKPWDDEQLLQKISDAAEVILIRKERDRLRKENESQAQLLLEANQTLEETVKSRTKELQQTADMLDLNYLELKISYSLFIDVIAQALQLRTTAPKDHINDIADTAEALAIALDLSEFEQDVVYKAAKLHELGKIRTPDTTLNKPLGTLTGNELSDYKLYPFQGYSLLTSLDNLSDVANLIKSHCEYYNGKGFPNHLSGQDIPIGSRIISISMFYFMYRNGLIDGQSHSDEAAEKFIRGNSGRLVDPNLVEPFLACVADQIAKKGKFESRVTIKTAEPGMVLTRDIFNLRGMIMLTKGAVLTSKIISKLHYIADKDMHDYALFVENKPEENDSNTDT